MSLFRTFLAFVTFVFATGPTRAATKLLPFQGHLTDAAGVAISSDVRVVQFKIYDSPVGGSAVWVGEVHKLSVNDGLVNTILGTKTSLEGVDFSSPLYLELTVDADESETITAADPPLLPRQIVLPTVFAVDSGNSSKLNGYDWTPLFGANDPTGPFDPEKIGDLSISASKLELQSISAAQIATNTITSSLIEAKAITPSLIADGAVNSNHIAPFAIGWTNLQTRVARTNSPNAGDVGVSSGTGDWLSQTPRILTKVTGLEVQLQTTGRPVLVFLTSQLELQSWIQSRRSGNGNGNVFVRLNRIGLDGGSTNFVGEFEHVNYANNPEMVVATSMFQFLDIPPEGTFQYEIYARTDSNDGDILKFYNVRMVAFEL